MSSLDQICCSWKNGHELHHDQLLRLLKGLQPRDWDVLLDQLQLESEKDFLSSNRIALIDLGDLAKAHYPHDIDCRGLKAARVISRSAAMSISIPEMTERTLI